MPSPVELHETTASRCWPRQRAGIRARVKALLAPQNIQHWIVLATILAALVAAGIHINTNSIWYDEAITLLTTSGHAKLNWSLGLGQFKPSANLAKIVVELYRQDVHPPTLFLDACSLASCVWRIARGSARFIRLVYAGHFGNVIPPVYRPVRKMASRPSADLRRFRRWPTLRL